MSSIALTNVWVIDTLDHMKTVPDYILVRSRWVMANKGDSKEPDFRARSVGCEVNKGGEKVDALLCLNSTIGSAKHFVFTVLVRAKPEGQALDNQFCWHQKSLLQWQVSSRSLYAPAKSIGLAPQSYWSIGQVCVRLP